MHDMIAITAVDSGETLGHDICAMSKSSKIWHEHSHVCDGLVPITPSNPGVDFAEIWAQAPH